MGLACATGAFLRLYAATLSPYLNGIGVAPQWVSPVESPHILTEMDKEHGIEKNPGLCT
jgi:hypothetical protein